MVKKVRVLLVILFLIPLTSCWSQKELTELAIVSAVGIDKKEDIYHVTYQIINPKNVAGGQQLGGGQTGPPINVYVGKGANITEAALSTNQLLSRVLYFDHASLVLFSEEVAKDGLNEVLDILERSPDFRITAKVAIAKDSSANEILKTLTPIDQINANKIRFTMENAAEGWGENLSLNVNEVIGQIYLDGSNPVISAVKITGDKDKSFKEDNVTASEPAARVFIDGLAVFKDDQFHDWISGKIARGTVWARGKVQSTVISVDWKGKKDSIATEIERAKTKIVPTIKNGKPSVKVLVSAEGSVSEVKVAIDLDKPEIIKELEQEVNKEITEEIKAAIKYAQEEKVDIFGFGEYIRVKDPKYFNTVKDNWNGSIFPDMDIEVNVEAFMRRTNLKIEPFFNKEKKMQSQ